MIKQGQTYEIYDLRKEPKIAAAGVFTLSGGAYEILDMKLGQHRFELDDHVFELVKGELTITTFEGQIVCRPLGSNSDLNVFVPYDLKDLPYHLSWF